MKNRHLMILIGWILLIMGFMFKEQTIFGIALGFFTSALIMLCRKEGK